MGGENAKLKMRRLAPEPRGGWRFVFPSTSRASFPTSCAHPRTRAMPPQDTEQARWFVDEVHAHDASLKAYLRGAFPAVNEVDDVVQESYLRIWRKRTEEPIRSAKNFLFRVARNLALDLVRRRASSPVHAVGDLAGLPVMAEQPGAIERLGSGEKLRLLGEAIAVLPPRSRELIVLCKIQGLTHREAAERLGLSVKTVDEHILRGLKRLGAELRARGLDQHFPV